MHWRKASEQDPPGVDEYIVKLTNGFKDIRKFKNFADNEVWRVHVLEWLDESDNEWPTSEKLQNWYREWAKKTGRSGGLLITTSIKEVLLAYTDWLKSNFK